MRALALTMTLLLTACGGGASTTASVSTAPVASAPAGAATAAPATSAPPTAAATAKPPSLLDLIGAAKTATYKVTYKWSGTGGGEAVAAEQTWYVRGAQSRFDFSTPEGSISLFDLADGTYFCTGGGRAGQATCLGMPKDAALQQNQGAAFSLALENRPDQFDQSFEGVRTIAGQSGQCFAVKDRAGLNEFGEGRICYTSGGIPLLMQSKGSGFDMTFEATAFSTTVTDADFRLPATPVKLPGAP